MLAMQLVQSVHAANAPLHAGDKGGKVFETFMAGMRAIINPKAKSAESVFARLKAKAQLRQ